MPQRPKLPHTLLDAGAFVSMNLDRSPFDGAPTRIADLGIWHRTARAHADAESRLVRGARTIAPVALPFVERGMLHYPSWQLVRRRRRAAPDHGNDLERV